MISQNEVLDTLLQFIEEKGEASSEAHELLGRIICCYMQGVAQQVVKWNEEKKEVRGQQGGAMAITTLGEAMEHLVQDSGELYANGEYTKAATTEEGGITEEERQIFERLHNLSSHDNFAEKVNELLERMEKESQ